MINIALLTSEDNELTERLVQYFSNIPDTQISCIISNIESDIHKRLRRYKIPSKTSSQYKDIDKFLTETKSHYIIIANYNETIPPNFCKKYNWRLININKTNIGIEIYYDKFENNKLIFKTNAFINDGDTQQIIDDKISELSYRYYPPIIENVIRETHKKIFKE